jgi:hypothetical protein
MVPGTGRDFNCSWTGCGKVMSFPLRADSLLRSLSILIYSLPSHLIESQTSAAIIGYTPMSDPTIAQ